MKRIYRSVKITSLIGRVWFGMKINNLGLLFDIPLVLTLPYSKTRFSQILNFAGKIKQT